MAVCSVKMIHRKYCCSIVTSKMNTRTETEASSD